ncbi:MAG: MFS transporter [Gammaproteobacteria bacterium]
MTQIQDITSPLTRIEKRAGYSLCGIYALRMFGLFLILPVLSLFTETLEGSTPMLIGLTMSIYGLSQALLQIPFGLFSDRYGRKRVIAFGLLLFSFGSIVAALSTSIYGVLIGRALQGSGAIAAAVMALAADLTQEVHRTKIMAMIGMTIGASFAAAIVVSPIIAGFAGIQGIFWLTAILALLALAVLVYVVPDPLVSKVHPDAEPVAGQFGNVLFNAELIRLNFGIFVLHLVLTAAFVAIPLMLRNSGLAASQHWQVYLPVLVASIGFLIPAVILAEKKRKMKAVFMGAIAILLTACLGMFVSGERLASIVIFVGLFFCGFNLLEAVLPSLISKTAPADMKGTAMGVYSTAQFLGAFAGGVMGGWLYGRFGIGAVFIGCSTALAVWLLVSASMTMPRHLANLLISLESLASIDEGDLTDALLEIKGVAEAKVNAREKIAYLKVDSGSLDKEQLQLFLSECKAS